MWMDAKTRDINFKINKKTYNNTVTHTRRKRKKQKNVMYVDLDIAKFA